jgi:hypothetical protein
MVKRNHKTLKKSLTASRKTEAQTTRPDRRHREAAGVVHKAAPAMRRPAESLTATGCLDRLDEHCDEIAAVAGLMERCGEDPAAFETVILGTWIKRKISDIKALALAAWEAKR